MSISGDNKYVPEGLTMLCATPLMLNRAATRKYDDLVVPCDQVLATYVWVDGTGVATRSKDRTLDFVPKTNKDMPIWYFDGSSTQQAPPDNSDTFLYPQVLYHDPFRRGSHMLALCDTYSHNYEATEGNYRKGCLMTCERADAEEPWFGFQQEVMLTGGDGRPLGWPAGGFPAPAGPYYCGVGCNRVVARDLMEAFYKCCLFAGIKMFGMNPGVAPAQWYYQLGPSPGIKSADELWMSRYILSRLAEEYGVLVSLEPQPVPSWPGSGASCYFSTGDMRQDDGILLIEKAVDALARRHGAHMAVYDAHDGADNVRRMSVSGGGGGCNHRDFTAGVANRNCSVRIPRQVSSDRRGYLEDRRPAANADPYRVVDIILRTCVLNE